MSPHVPARRPFALGTASVLATAALSVSLLAAPPAQATQVRDAAAATVAATPVPDTATTKAATKAARVKARKQARAAYERSVRERVVALAKKKLKSGRYVAGAAGPNAFDCSGLAMYVWRKAAGRHLPHYSGAQQAATRRVSRQNIKPGDLVFFMHGAHHVAIYIGHGMMIGAANPSSGIQKDRVWSGWYGQHYSAAGRLF